MGKYVENSYVAINEINKTNMNLAGIIGKIVDKDESNNKYLINPEYRIKNIKNADPPDSLRLWIKADKLVKVYIRNQTAEVRRPGKLNIEQIEGNKRLGIKKI